MSVLVLLLALLTALVSAQNCYYPDGAVSTSDGACSSDGMCCPLNWSCLSNGLCYYEPNDFYGRYTCTDQDWNSGNCPDLCTQNGTASGNEAILRCPNGNYCCDGDRSFDCCSLDDTTFFSLPAGTSTASITELESPTSVPSSSPRSSTPISTPSSTLSSSSSATSASTTSPSTSSGSPTEKGSTSESSSTSTTTQTSISSGVNGVSTITKISIATVPAPSNTAESAGTNASDTSDRSSPPPKELIIGLAIGIPFALVLMGIIGYLMLRRTKTHRNHSTSSTSPFTNFANRPEMAHAYGHFPPEGRAPELDSYPVAVTPGTESELSGASIYGSPVSSPFLSSRNSVYSQHQLPAYSPSLTGVGSPTFRTGFGLQPVNEEPAELWSGPNSIGRGDDGYAPDRPSIDTTHLQDIKEPYSTVDDIS